MSGPAGRGYRPAGPGPQDLSQLPLTAEDPLTYLFVPLILLVVVALVWSWWTARSDRDPASSVGHFNRALSAMQPGDRSTPPRPPSDASGTDAGDDDPSRDA